MWNNNQTEFFLAYNSRSVLRACLFADGILYKRRSSNVGIEKANIHLSTVFVLNVLTERRQVCSEVMR